MEEEKPILSVPEPVEAAAQRPAEPVLVGVSRSPEGQTVYQYRTPDGTTVELFKPYRAADEVRAGRPPKLGAPSALAASPGGPATLGSFMAGPGTAASSTFYGGPGGGADYGVAPAAFPPIGSRVGSFAAGGPSHVEEVPEEVEEPMSGGFTIPTSKVDTSESAAADAAARRGGINGQSMVTGMFRTPRAQML